MATASITEGWLRKHVPTCAGGNAPDPPKERAPISAGGRDPTSRPKRVFDASLPGFGVVIGARSVTFIVRGRVEVEEDGETRTVRRDVTIGRWQRVGAGEDLSELWTEAKARKRALRELGKIAEGEDPIERDDPTNGPTLRDGLILHLSNMRISGGKGRHSNGQSMPCSPRSIRNVEDEVTKHLADWLERPIVELTALELSKVVKNVLTNASPRAGTVNPPGAALAKRLVRHVSAIWASTNELHDLPLKNPAGSVRTHGLAPKEVRIEPDEFAPWYGEVFELSPVRRDFNLVALFTAVRSEGLRHLVWEDVDFEDHVLHVRRAKGNRPYSIPMVETVEDILRARKRENKELFALYGGDAGYVFPTVTRAKPFKVIPLVSTKEYEEYEEGDEVRRETSMPTPHVLRKTWNSVAIEARIPPEDREALMNHDKRGVNIRHYGFPRNWDMLRESAQAVERRLLDQLERKKPRRRRQRVN